MTFERAAGEWLKPSKNSDVKANSTWVFLFFIYSLFHTDFCRFDVRYNDINVSISSSESDSEFRAMSLAIADFAILQETTSQCALTLCHAVFPMLSLPAVLCPALRPPASQYALTLCHAVFPVLRLPALRPPASQCAPGHTCNNDFPSFSRTNSKCIWRA